MIEHKHNTKKIVVFSISSTTITILIVGLTVWCLSPIPVISQPVYITEIEVHRFGSYNEKYSVDNQLNASLIECLHQYSSYPRLFRQYYPRILSRIPFQLELHFHDQGPKHVILGGGDYFWYRSASGFFAIYNDIENGEALLNEILEISGITK